MNNNETPNGGHKAGALDRPVKREIDLENCIIHASINSDRRAEKFADAIKWAMTRLSKSDKEYLAELSGINSTRHEDAEIMQWMLENKTSLKYYETDKKARWYVESANRPGCTVSAWTPKDAVEKAANTWA